MQLFFEQGYERTTLQQIAKRANLSTATLFKRFSSKAALFEAIVEEFWRVDGPPTGIPRPETLRPVFMCLARTMHVACGVPKWRPSIGDHRRGVPIAATRAISGRETQRDLISIASLSIFPPR